MTPRGTLATQTPIPLRLQPLFQYLAFISRCSRRFQPYAWLQYDAQFRLKIASNPSMSWSVADPEFIASWLTADAIKHKSTCFSCGNPDHLSSDCPLRPSTKEPGLYCPVCDTSGHVARDCPQLLQGKPNATTTKPQTMCAYFSTDVVVVFEDSATPTLTSAQTVVAVTQSSPAPSRPADSSPIHAHTIHTPLRPHLFARFLNTHPEKALVSKLLLSLRFGFRIGYNGPYSPLTAPNLRSALEHPDVVDEDVVDEALRKEVAENRIPDPYPYHPYQNLRCSGLGVVPKSDGSWRLIYHLSAPIGNSINDIIDPLEYSLQYSTIDDAITICHSLGPGALISKVDLKNAFRLCPVHLDDWQLLGIH